MTRASKIISKINEVTASHATHVGTKQALDTSKQLVQHRLQRKQLQKAQAGLASSGGTGIT